MTLSTIEALKSVISILIEKGFVPSHTKELLREFLNKTEDNIDEEKKEKSNQGKNP